MLNQADNQVLIVGVYLLDAPNHALSLSRTFLQSRDWAVDLRWAAVGTSEVPPELAGVTVATSAERRPKFHILNDIIGSLDTGQAFGRPRNKKTHKQRLRDHSSDPLERTRESHGSSPRALGRYRYVIVTDDDIELGEGFVDGFLRLTEKYRLALSQPARTHDSYIDHFFVAQLLGVEARITRFVEIGPLFAIGRDLYPLLLPFDEKAPMGWGLDFVWPVQLDSVGHRLGIVDATPVKHALRKPVALYDYEETRSGMESFLRSRPHIARTDAFIALETFPLTEEQA